MSSNRISSYPASATSVPVAAGFAVCHLPQSAPSALTLQLIAQQQAYEQALLQARERALEMTQARLRVSPN